jgi:dolichol-phosphate mannosyltransferase
MVNGPKARNMTKPSARTRAQFVIFLGVGGSAFVVDAGLTAAFQLMGLSAQWARVPALALTIVFTFFANRKLTFAKAGSLSWSEFGAYVGASLIGVVINYAVYWLVLHTGLHWLVAAGAGTLVAAIFNFVVYRRIFKPASPGS